MTLTRIVQRVTRQLTSASDVWLAARVLAWAAVLPAMKHLVPVKSLASVMHHAPRVSPRRTPRDAALEARIITFARWGARLTRWKSGGNCLERGLIAYRYLGAAGAEPTLVVGIARDERAGVTGHAWVLVDGRPAGESEASISIYTAVFAFAPDGTLQDVPPQDVPP